MTTPSLPPRSLLLPAPWGELRVDLLGERIVGVDFHPAETDHPPFEGPLAEQIRAQFAAYFANGLNRFDLPLQLSGTPFQQQVWRLLQAIPPGSTLTYGEAATQLDSSARAVGNACRANPAPLIVPCHRMLAKGGIGGFAGEREGARVEEKRWLLRHEGVDL